jgi:hypothetical protein
MGEETATRATSSLAILKVIWDRHQDHIEIFLPFLATLMSRKRYGRVEVSRLREDFREEYGLAIPYYPMITILTRARKRGLIRKHQGAWEPIREAVVRLDFTALATEHQQKQQRVLRAFGEFCKRDCKMALERDEAESALMSFLKRHDLDVLCASQERSVLPEVRSPKSHLFLASKFVKWAWLSDREVFAYIVDMAIGHLLANAILYGGVERLGARLDGARFYLDTRLILRLRGIDGPELQTASADLLSTLRQQGGLVCLFRHTYDEATGILNACLRWVEDPSYDPARASNALMFFVDRGYKRTDVETFVVKTDGALRDLGVEIVERPDPSVDTMYQIDEKALHDIIVQTYQEFSPWFEELDKELTLWRDVNSISAVYKLRRMSSPRTIKEAKHIFITTNSALACAARRFDAREEGDRLRIPACLTDIFIGTVLWLQRPATGPPVNSARIIAECYAALRPSVELLRELADSTDRLREQGEISEDEYFALRTSREGRELLADATMGDPANFTPQTPAQILREMKFRIKTEAEEKHREERATHEQTRAELQALKKNAEDTERATQALAGGIGSAVGNAFLVVGVSLAVASLVPQVLPVPCPGLPARVLAGVMTFVLTLASVVFGLDVRGARSWIRERVRARVAAWLIGRRGAGRR